MAAELDSTSLISDIMERWPVTLDVFLSYRMACPGCSRAGLETLADAAECYGISVGKLMADIEMVIVSAVDGGA